MWLLQDVAVNFQSEPLMVPASTVWKTIFSIIASLALVIWRLGKYLWNKHSKDIDKINEDSSKAFTAVNAKLDRDAEKINAKLDAMTNSNQKRFEELEDVQDAIVQSTVKIADFQANRKEIRESIHELHLKVDSHHKEQMAVLISILRPERMKQ